MSHRQSVVKMLLLILVFGLFALSIILPLREPARINGVEAERMRAKRQLEQLNTYLVSCAGDDPTKVPVEPREVLKHLENCGFSGNSYAINQREGILVDRWGSPVVIISSENRFTGVGSGGPDGVWEGGEGDDVVATIADIPTRLGEPNDEPESQTFSQ